MSRIERIYVLCHGADLWMARICIASIRHWYPDVPIALLRNQAGWRADTEALETAYAVRTIQTPPGRFGSSLAKLDLLVRPVRERYLFLDADIVLLGPVLESLEGLDEDFVVSAFPGVPPDSPAMRKYYHIEQLLKLDPDFEPPGFCFNSGHYVATSGLLTADDLAPFIDFRRAPPRHRTQGVFHGTGDQGLCNYLFPRKAQAGVLSLATYDFALWAHAEEAASLSLETVLEGPGIPMLLHWAGTQPPLLRSQPRADILRAFQDEYAAAAHRTARQMRAEQLVSALNWALWRARTKLAYALGLR